MYFRYETERFCIKASENNSNFVFFILLNVLLGTGIIPKPFNNGPTRRNVFQLVARRYQRWISAFDVEIQFKLFVSSFVQLRFRYKDV